MSSLATSSGSLNTSIATARSRTTVNASTANGRSPSNATTPAAPLTSAGRTYGARRRAWAPLSSPVLRSSHGCAEQLGPRPHRPPDGHELLLEREAVGQLRVRA